MWTDPQPSSISSLLCQTSLRSITAPYEQMDYFRKTISQIMVGLSFPNEIPLVSHCWYVKLISRSKARLLPYFPQSHSTKTLTPKTHSYLSSMFMSLIIVHQGKRPHLGGIHLASLPGLQGEAGTTRCDSSDTGLKVNCSQAAWLWRGKMALVLTAPTRDMAGKLLEKIKAKMTAPGDGWALLQRWFFFQVLC